MADVPYTVFSFIAFLLCIPPAYFNWKIPYRPWATLILIGWIALINLLFFADSIIWASENVETWWAGYGYCDINARLKDMFAIGVPGAAVGICRFLADATNPDPAQKDLQCHRTRRNMIDLFLGVGFPIVIIAFKFIGEYSRYHIEGVNGCTGTIELSWPSLVLYPIWCPVLCLVAAAYALRFIRHWWVRRRRLNEFWTSGLRNGISKGDFQRLMVTVLAVIFVYLPLSLYGLAGFLMAPKVPFSISRIHGPLWKFILFDPRPTALWSSWIGVALAFASFILIGFTRNAKQAYFTCVEWIYDHSPTKLKTKLSGMEKIASATKERRTVQKPDMSFETVPHRSRRSNKNWFDVEDEADAKSLHSSDLSLDEVDSTTRHSDFDLNNPRGMTKTEVSAGFGSTPGWDARVQITRQVIVESTTKA